MFMSVIQKRRSIRRYQKRALPPDQVNQLVEAALRAPSSMGTNPWEFIVVTDPKVLAQLSRAKPHGATFLKDAPLGIVVCANPEKSQVWIEDCAIAAIFIHLAAQAQGLGSCWIQIRNRMHDETRSAEAYVAEILGIPDPVKIEAIVAAGYPEEEKPPHPRETLPYEKVYEGTYGAPFRPWA